MTGRAEPSLLHKSFEVDLLRRRICCPTEAVDFLADLQVSLRCISTGGFDQPRWKMLGPCLSLNANLRDSMGLNMTLLAFCVRAKGIYDGWWRFR